MAIELEKLQNVHRVLESTHQTLMQHATDLEQDSLKTAEALKKLQDEKSAMETAHAKAVKDQEDAHAAAMQDKQDKHQKLVDNLDAMHAKLMQEKDEAHAKTIQDKEDELITLRKKLEGTKVLLAENQKNAQALQDTLDDLRLSMEQIQANDAARIEELEEQLLAAQNAMKALKDDHLQAMNDKENNHALQFGQAKEEHAVLLSSAKKEIPEETEKALSNHETRASIS